MPNRTLDPQVLTYCCDEVTSTVIAEALCLGVHAIADLDDFEKFPAQMDPMAFVIDGTRAMPQMLENALCVHLKKWPYCVRLVLVAATDDDAMENAFRCGASDVLRKPLRPQELLVRMRVRLKHLGELRKNSQFIVGDVVIDQKQRVILRGETSTQLSQLSFDVLMQLAEMPRLVVPRADLKRRGWQDTHVADGSLDRQMHELRRCLSMIGSKMSIKSVYGEGYMLADQD